VKRIEIEKDEREKNKTRRMEEDREGLSMIYSNTKYWTDFSFKLWLRVS
jgi:hypothetical protein